MFDSLTCSLLVVRSSLVPSNFSSRQARWESRLCQKKKKKKKKKKQHTQRIRSTWRCFLDAAISAFTFRKNEPRQRNERLTRKRDRTEHCCSRELFKFTRYAIRRDYRICDINYSIREFNLLDARFASFFFFLFFFLCRDYRAFQGQRRGFA